MQPIPTSLAPFFQEYDLAVLNPQKDAHTIIERALQFGNRAELRWLFSVYSREQIAAWVRQFGNEKLPQPHRAFWQVVFDETEIKTEKGNRFMTKKDIRWIQRFNNFTKAFLQLKEAVDLSEQRELSRLEGQGLLQAFEYTHELAWNTLKDFLEDRGATNLFGSKDVTRAAFTAGLIENGETWMQMIESRNLTTHTYDEATAAKIISVVIGSYFAEFEKLQTKLATFKKEGE